MNIAPVVISNEYSNFNEVLHVTGGIKIIYGRKSSFSESELSAFYKYRQKVFIGRLGWPLKTNGVTEIDEFDLPDTIYVIAFNDNGDICGHARLNPTTGPCLMDIFPTLFNGSPPPSTPLVWEISRLSTHNSDQSSPVKGGISYTNEMMMKTCFEIIAKHGASRLVAVTSPMVERLYSKSNYPLRRAGPPELIDGSPVIACWIESK
ncbi:MAG: acyl-homoserine-lactone synthase [Sedimenticola sp.]